MSANLGSIKTRVKALLSNSTMLSDTDLLSVIQADHDTVLNDNSWSRRKADTLLTLVAPVTAGTISSVSSTTVTGSSTAWSSSNVDSYIRIGSATYFHLISSVASATSLTIEAAYPASVSSGTSYRIFKHVYDLPSDFGRVTNVTCDIRFAETSRESIDRWDPYRSATATRPDFYTVRGLDTNPSGVFQIEFWPVPSSAQAVRVEYLKTNSLSSDSDEPLYRSDVLVWKAAESCSFLLHGKTGDAAWLQLADRFHARYLEALQGAKEDDLARYSPTTYVRDSAGRYGRSSDWYVEHDDLRLR